MATINLTDLIASSYPQFDGGAITLATAITSSTQATSTTTGALVVTGGAGIGKNLHVGGTITGTATTATNLAGGTQGTVPYQSAAGVTAMLSTGTTGQVLTMSAGTPSWQTPTAGGTPFEVFTFGGTGTPTIGTAMTPYLRVMSTVTSSAASLIAKTAPTGNFTVSILRSANNGTTFPDTVATITVTSGNRVGTATPTTALAVGDLLRLDITAVNSAADWTAQLYTTA